MPWSYFRPAQDKTVRMRQQKEKLCLLVITGYFIVGQSFAEKMWKIWEIFAGETSCVTRPHTGDLLNILLPCKIEMKKRLLPSWCIEK